MQTKEDSIANKTANSTFWGALTKVLTMGTQFVVTMVLARLLTPESYGTIALLTVFVAISNAIIECGFANALIRKQDCTSADYSTAIYFNIVLGVALYGLIFVCSPYISIFYKDPGLTIVLKVYALVIVFNSMRVVQNAILIKTLQFKKIARITAISSVSSGGIAILLAYLNAGVWALVAQGLICAAIEVICLWISTKIRLTREFSLNSLTYLWGFGSKMLFTGVLSAMYANMYSIVIGKAYAQTSLGLFNRGNAVARIFPSVMSNAIAPNSLSILSTLQNDRTRLISVYRKFIEIASFISFPIVLLMVALAKPLVLFLLTEKWSDMIIYVQIFAMSTVMETINVVNQNIFQVDGRTDIALKLELIKKLSGILMIFLLIPCGPVVLAIGSSIFSLFAYLLNLLYAKNLIKMGYLQQLKDISPFMICAIIASLLAYVITLLPMPHILQLLLGLCIGSLSYVVLTKYLFKVGIYGEIENFVKDKITRK